MNPPRSPLVAEVASTLGKDLVAARFTNSKAPSDITAGDGDGGCGGCERLRWRQVGGS